MNKNHEKQHDKPQISSWKLGGGTLMQMLAIIFIGFMAGIATMIVLNLYKHVLKIMNSNL